MDEKLQYDINREAAISVLSSEKIDQYEYLVKKYWFLIKDK